MKKVFGILILLCGLSLSCSEEEAVLPPPNDLVVSEGTLIGVVRVVAPEVTGAQQYDFERYNEITDAWTPIAKHGWRDFDDRGCDMSAGHLEAGHTYRYRVRTYKEGSGYSPYSPEVEGYPFEVKPAEITHYLVEDHPSHPNMHKLTLTWTSQIESHVCNMEERWFHIRYADAGNPNTWFNLASYSNHNNTVTEVSGHVYVPKARDYYFRVDTEFKYSYMEKQMHKNGTLTMAGKSDKEVNP